MWWTLRSASTAARKPSRSMSSMYASSSSQKTSFVCCAEAADALVQLARGDRAAAARRARRAAGRRSPRRACTRAAGCGAGTCEATSCGSSSRSAARKPIVGQALERVEQRRVPARAARRRRRRRARPGTAPSSAGRRARSAFWPMFFSLRDDADPRIVERLEVLGRPVGRARCPRSRSRASRPRSGAARSRRTCCSRCTRLCVSTTTAMPSSDDVGRRRRRCSDVSIAPS